MRINKFKVLSVAVCCWVASLCSETQSMDKMDQIHNAIHAIYQLKIENVIEDFKNITIGIAPTIQTNLEGITLGQGIDSWIKMYEISKEKFHHKHATDVGIRLAGSEDLIKFQPKDLESCGYWGHYGFDSIMLLTIYFLADTVQERKF